MFLPINSERRLINEQIKAIEKMSWKMPVSNSTTAEFTNARALFRLIENHLGELNNPHLSTPEPTEGKSFSLYLEINTRIKNHVARRYERVKSLLGEGKDGDCLIDVLRRLSNIFKELTAIESKISDAVLRQ